MLIIKIYFKVGMPTTNKKVCDAHLKKRRRNTTYVKVGGLFVGHREGLKLAEAIQIRSQVASVWTGLREQGERESSTV